MKICKKKIELVGERSVHFFLFENNMEKKVQQWMTNNTSKIPNMNIPEKYLNLTFEYNKTNLECLDKILDQELKRELTEQVKREDTFKKLVGTVLSLLLQKPLFVKENFPLKPPRTTKLQKDDERLFPRCLEIVFWILGQLYREKEPGDRDAAFRYAYNTVINAFDYILQQKHPTKDPDIDFKDLEGRICGILTKFSYWTSINNIITLMTIVYNMDFLRNFSMRIAGTSIDAFYAYFMESTHLSTILTQMMAFVKNVNLSFIHIDSQMAFDTYRLTESHVYGLANYLGIEIPSVATAIQTNPYLANVVSFILPYVSTANVGLFFIVMLTKLFTKEQTYQRKLGYLLSILYYMKYSIYIVNVQFFSFIISWLFICLLTNEVYDLCHRGVTSVYYLKQHLTHILWSLLSGKK